MTKTKNQKSRKGTSAHSRSWLLALIIILAVVAIVILVVWFTKPQTSDPEPASPTASQSPTSSEPAPEAPTSEIPESSETPEAPDKTTQYEGQDPNTLEELTGVIISKDVENGTLTIMTMINQYLHQTGFCTITLTGRNSRDVYTATEDAHADISSSYCENFAVPVSKLSSDTYDIEIKLTGDGKTGTIRDEVKL